MNPPKPEDASGPVPEVKKPAILDPLTVKFGISFKAHKTSENIVQILYVRQVGNAIE